MCVYVYTCVCMYICVRESVCVLMSSFFHTDNFGIDILNLNAILT